MKKFLSCVLAIIMVISSASLCFASEEKELSVYVFGKKVEFSDVKPYIDPNTSRTLVPLRAVFENIGVKISWDEENSAVTAVNGDTLIILTIGSNTATINSSKTELDQCPVILNGRTMIPLRFVAESLNLSVEWIASDKTVKIEHEEGYVEPTESPSPSAQAEINGAQAGTYKVGEDIPAGEYYLLASGDAAVSFYDTEYSETSTVPAAKKYTFSGSFYITTAGCSYIKTENCTLYDMNNLPAVTEKTEYSAGMYKAGYDIRATKYVAQKKGSNAKYSVYGTPFGITEPQSEASDKITGSKSFTVAKDKYLVIEGATFKISKTAPASGGGGGSSSSSSGSSSGGSSGNSSSGSSGSSSGDSSTSAPTSAPTSVPTEEPTETPEPWDASILDSNPAFITLPEAAYVPDFGAMFNFDYNPDTSCLEGDIRHYSYDVGKRIPDSSLLLTLTRRFGLVMESNGYIAYAGKAVIFTDSVSGYNFSYKMVNRDKPSECKVYITFHEDGSMLTQEEISGIIDSFNSDPITGEDDGDISGGDNTDNETGNETGNDETIDDPQDDGNKADGDTSDEKTDEPTDGASGGASGGASSGDKPSTGGNPLDFPDE